MIDAPTVPMIEPEHARKLAMKNNLIVFQASQHDIKNVTAEYAEILAELAGQITSGKMDDALEIGKILCGISMGLYTIAQKLKINEECIQRMTS